MKYSLNSTVIVTPKADDIFSYEFQGTIIDYLELSNTYLVKDQDDDVFEVEEDQIDDKHMKKCAITTSIKINNDEFVDVLEDIVKAIRDGNTVELSNGDVQIYTTHGFVWLVKN